MASWLAVDVLAASLDVDADPASCVLLHFCPLARSFPFVGVFAIASTTWRLCSSTRACSLAAHRILIPAFGPLSIRNMFDDMSDICEQLIAKWERFGPHATIDVTNDFTRLTLDTLALCTMSTRFNSFYSSEPPPFVEAMARSLTQSGANVRRLKFPGSGIVYAREDEQYRKDIETQRRIVQELIDERVANPDPSKKDLLNAMLHGKDPVTGKGLSHENIIYQLITFSIAGHETTSGMLSFLFYFLLCKNPDAYQAIRREVDDVCGSEPVKVEQLAKLKYIDAALKECLRLEPTAPGFTVTPENDLVVQGRDGRYMLPKDSPCVVILHALHRDPSVWGPDAEEYRPERMLDGRFEKLAPDSWKPFGNGMRACIGRPFAWQEALLVVARLFQTFDFYPADSEYKLQHKSTLTIKPKGFYMHARVRKDRKVWAAHPSSGTVKLSPSDQAIKDQGDAKATSIDDAQLLIYYGSNSGTCESFAHTLLSSAQGRGCKAVIAGTLNTMAGGNIPNNKPIVIITASYEGKPTDDAALFVSWLEKTAAQDAARGVKYAVFGCGHTDWASTYHAVPKAIDAKLSELGGTRLLERGVGNAAGPDLFGEFEAFVDRLWPALEGHVDVGSASSPDAKSLEAVIDRKYRVEKLRHGFLESATVLSNKVITVGDVEVKRHIEFELSEDTTYRSGDYLGILPVVPLAVVRRALARFKLHADDMITLKSATSSVLPIDQPLSAFDLLSAFLELEHPASLKCVKLLVDLAQSQEEKEALGRLAEPDMFASEIAAKRVSLLALLEDYPRIDMPLATYLANVPAMRMRQYSISSSPLAHPHRLSLTIAVLDAPHLSGRPGQRYAGTASNFLAQLQPGSYIRAAIRPSQEAFHPPEDPSTPMICIAAGSGVAPFRGYVQERALQKASGRDVGKTLLFYGCHSRSTDLLYDDEMAQWEQDGVVEVRHAFSRAPQDSQGCKYAQDRLWHDREEAAELFRAGARVYLCGSAGLANGVRAKIIEIFVERTGITEDEAKAKLDEITGSRFATDVFG